jgi:hypothetical protein
MMHLWFNSVAAIVQADAVIADAAVTAGATVLAAVLAAVLAVVLAVVFAPVFVFSDAVVVVSKFSDGIRGCLRRSDRPCIAKKYGWQGFFS